MLIRSWNLFHGNTDPAGNTNHLEEMVRLASEDRPDLLLLQEIPAWALDRLGEWSGMAAIADVAQPPRIGPVRISAGLGRLLTSIRPALLRSAFAGQGNAILLSDGIRALSREVVVLNPADFRRKEAHRLGLDLVSRLAWAKERRICQIVRLEQSLIVAHLHASSFPGHREIPEAELHRAEAAALERSVDGEVVVVGGDFNVTGQRAELDGFSEPGPYIDHILVRGTKSSPVHTWPGERRRRGGMLLSDHAPIEVKL